MKHMNSVLEKKPVEESITLEEAVDKYEHMVYDLVKYRPVTPVCSYEDMIQEGRMAIVDAYNTYDPSYGAKLGTWVWRRIQNALAEFQKKNLMCLSGGAAVYQKIKNQDNPNDLVAQRLREAFCAKNLDDLTQVVGAEDVEHDSFAKFDWRSYLNEEEIFVVEHSFGFNGGETLGLREIGVLMGGKSRKAVDYILGKAIVKLRHIPGIEDFWFD